MGKNNEDEYYARAQARKRRMEQGILPEPATLDYTVTKLQEQVEALKVREYERAKEVAAKAAAAEQLAKGWQAGARHKIRKLVDQQIPYDLASLQNHQRDLRFVLVGPDPEDASLRFAVQEKLEATNHVLELVEQFGPHRAEQIVAEERYRRKQQQDLSSATKQAWWNDPLGADEKARGTMRTNAIKAFQKRHGLRPDGIAGPVTHRKIQDLKSMSVRESGAVSNMLTEPTAGSVPITLWKRGKYRIQKWQERGGNILYTVHDGTRAIGPVFNALGDAETWADEQQGVTKPSMNSGYAKGLDGILREFSLVPTTIQRPEQFVSMAKGGVTGDLAEKQRAHAKYAQQQLVPKIRKPRPQRPATEEQLKEKIRNLGYVVGKTRWFGYTALVDLEDGGSWLFWRPTKDGADRVGRKRMFREVERAEHYYEVEHGAVKRTAAQLHPDYRPSLTEEQQKDWDEQFRKAEGTA